MLTYVINTSENKTFDSNLLFELVGYAQIRWKCCSLHEIELCAKEISQEEKSKILDKGEYRVVVLVDFFDYNCTDANNDEAAGEYVEIYKNFVEKYLLDRLFGVLKRNNAAPKYCEIYYIQYTEYSPLIANNMEKEQVAHLLGLETEEKSIRNARIEDAKKYNQSLGSANDAKNITLDNYEPGSENISAEEDKKYDFFELKCTNDVRLIFDFKEAKTFDQFYEEDYKYSKNDAKKSGVISHKPYVTSGDAGRAAYDALALSLYLVKTYERKGDTINTDIEIERPNDRKLIDRLKVSLRKIHSARKEALNNECRYFILDPQADETESAPARASSVSRSSKVVTDPKKQYELICKWASNDGILDEDDQKRIDRHMDEYLSRRDDLRSKIRNSIGNNLEEKEEEMDYYFPSEIDYKKALKKRQDSLSECLATALDAEYQSQDFSKLKKEADEAYDQFMLVKLKETKTILGDIAMLLLAVISTVVPFVVLQPDVLPIKSLAALPYLIAAGIFGAVFVLLALARIFIANRRISIAKSDLSRVFEECLKKKNAATDALVKKFDEDLIRVEQIRHNINLIKLRNKLNKEKNKHVEAHREKLEEVENTLSGMLNSFGEKPDLSGYDDVHGDFTVEKPIIASENRVYKIFSIEAIEEMFEKRGGIR